VAGLIVFLIFAIVCGWCSCSYKGDFTDKTKLDHAVRPGRLVMDPGSKVT